jgi:hypothetical protein
MKVDIGENIVALLEKLAAQVGTTADKIFPWYVQQQLIYGWTFLVLLAVGLAVGVTLVARNLKKTDWDRGTGVAPVLIGSIILAVSAIAAAVNLAFAIGQVVNPEYGAMRALLAQITGR